MQYKLRSRTICCLGGLAMKSLTQWLNEKQDLALLLVRIGVGLMFIFVHGAPKVFGGVAAWTKLGSMIGVLGIALIAIVAFSVIVRV